MEFSVLGPLEARHDGRPIPLGSRKQRALLAMLLLRANEVVSSDALIDDLWGERPPPSAAHTLQVYVSRLRAALRDGGASDGALLTHGAGYMLRVGFGELDLDRFGHLADEGRRALAAGSPERAAAKLREALALWRGDPLVDLAFEPFARIDVERLGERRLVAVEDLLDAELMCGRHAVVVPELEALVAQHPLRERLRGQLMLAFYRAGRQAEALDAYRDARDYLVGELGLEPSKELRALEQAVLRQDESLELRAVERRPVTVLTAAVYDEDVETSDLDDGADSHAVAVPSGNALPERVSTTDASAAQRRPPLVVLAGVAVLVLGAAAAAIAVSDRGPSRVVEAADVHANAVVFVGAGTRAIVAQHDVGGRPTALSSGAGALWVADAANDRVLEIDPTSARVEDQIQVGREPGGIVATGGGVWVTNAGSGTVSEVSPATGTVVATVRVGNAPAAITAGAGAVWVADASDGTVRRIDPGRASVVSVIQLGQPLDRVAFGLGAVWVTSATSGLLIRIDPKGNRPVQTVAVGNGPTSIAFTPEVVWIANGPDGTISRVDNATGAVRKINVSDPGELVFFSGSVWVARPKRRDIVPVDPRTGNVGRAIPTGTPAGAVVVSNGRLVFATLASPARHRGGTLHVVAGNGLDSIDPGQAYSALGWQILSLTNDGLVTYARNAGPAGATVVPDLAISLPLVQERGRTFTFGLRPGARYSSGAPIRLEDFRSSIERQYLASTGLAAVGVPIVGAENCTKARCDLSRGVVLDDAARTITFRLSAPDPAFLYQLALPFGAVVPTGSPAVGTSARPLPATGPYIIERYEPGREIVLRRNRRFHSWSAAAQPEGFPDRIAFALGLDVTRQAAAVSAGRADVMLDSPTPSTLSQLERHAPLQLHRSALPEVLAMFLNTRHPPFDDPRVRRALGLAVDRAAVVRIAGGARVARATCQILPPTFPGYQPFCPSTAASNAAGVWRAPDLERARQLIASSGTAGMPVRVSTMRTDERKLATARYFVLLLRSLGYQTTLRAYDSEHAYYGAVGLASSNSQIGVFGWAADYEAGSAFFQPLFTCTAYTPTRPFGMNAAAFCDPELDREIADATALQLTNLAAANAAWARVDRQVTSRAPWIPLVNPIAIDFVSSRVGNYMRNPAFGILLDQLWVR